MWMCPQTNYFLLRVIREKYSSCVCSGLMQKYFDILSHEEVLIVVWDFLFPVYRRLL